jgi:antitoxin YefM
VQRAATRTHPAQLIAALDAAPAGLRRIDKPTAEATSGTLSCTRHRRRSMTAITATEARKRLFPLIEEVNDDRTAVEIVSKHGNAVLMSKAEFDSWQETAYLLSTPANARRLLEAMERARQGLTEEHDLIR